MIGRLRHKISSIFRQPPLSVWLLEGAEKNSRQNLVIAYAGLERHKNYFSRLAFEEAAKETLVGQYPAWSLRKRLSGLGQDLTVVELNEAREKFYCAGKGPRVPLWVWAACDLSGGRQAFETSRRYRTHRQRVRQHDLVYRVWTDESSLKDFYENMYLPYAAYRYSDSTFTYSYEEVRSKFLTGQLGGLERNGVPVVSQVTGFQGKSAHAFVMGVRQGEEELLRKGVLEVHSYLTLLHLMEKNYSSLELGYSRGFLNDGVLRNKLRLGARLNGSIHKESGYLAYQIHRWTGAVQSFLSHNPVVLEEKGEFWAGYFRTDKAEDLREEELRKNTEDLREDGFEGVKIIERRPDGRLETRDL